MTSPLATLLTELETLLHSRKTADAKQSYTAQLLQGNEDALLKKIIEEAGEVVLAAKKTDPQADKQALVEELADLWFHCLIVMTRYNVSLSDLATVLTQRRGQSGLAEKQSRHQ